LRSIEVRRSGTINQQKKKTNILANESSTVSISRFESKYKFVNVLI